MIATFVYLLYLSADVYEYIKDCETYAAAIEKLESIYYIKTPNILFARYKLATKKQQPTETLENFFHLLHLLSKDCYLQAVTTEEYQNKLVRDAFINEILSNSIRQLLLETNRLINQAFDKTFCLKTAQEHSKAYFNPADTAAVVSPSSETKSFSNQANAEFALNSTN